MQYEICYYLAPCYLLTITNISNMMNFFCLVTKLPLYRFWILDRIDLSRLHLGLPGGGWVMILSLLCTVSHHRFILYICTKWNALTLFVMHSLVLFNKFYNQSQQKLFFKYLWSICCQYFVILCSPAKNCIILGHFSLSHLSLQPICKHLVHNILYHDN